MTKAAIGDSKRAHITTYEIHDMTGGSISDDGPNRGGYSALIKVRYEDFDASLLQTAFSKIKPANSTGFGLKAITSERVTIDSPGRGYARRKDWGRFFHHPQYVSALYSFGQQIAAIEAHEGVIKRIEVHVIAPPVGHSVDNWVIH